MPLSRKVISEEEEISLKMTFAQPFNESLTAPLRSHAPWAGRRASSDPRVLGPLLCPLLTSS